MSSRKDSSYSGYHLASATVMFAFLFFTAFIWLNDLSASYVEVRNFFDSYYYAFPFIWIGFSCFGFVVFFIIGVVDKRGRRNLFLSRIISISILIIAHLSFIWIDYEFDIIKSTKKELIVSIVIVVVSLLLAGIFYFIRKIKDNRMTLQKGSLTGK